MTGLRGSTNVATLIYPRRLTKHKPDLNLKGSFSLHPPIAEIVGQSQTGGSSKIARTTDRADFCQWFRLRPCDHGRPHA
jgi:hypothetical protein